MQSVKCRVWNLQWTVGNTALATQRIWTESCPCHAKWHAFSPRESLAPVTRNVFRHHIEPVRMSRNPTPCTQTGIETCLKNVSNERRFLQNQFFHTNFPMNLKICYIKIDVSSDEACCACRATFWGRFIKCGPCHEKRDSLVESDAKSIALVRQRFSIRCETCWNVTNNDACHANRGDGTFEISKSDNFSALWGPHADSCKQLRAVADGRRRLRTQMQRPATTPLTPGPDPKSETGSLATHPARMVLQDIFSDRNVVRGQIIFEWPGLKGTSPRHWTTNKKMEA